MARMSKERARLARQVGVLTAIPFVLLAGPAVGYLAGDWLDRRFGTAPIFLIVLLVVGFAAAGRETYKLILLASREDEAAAKQESERPGPRAGSERGAGVSGKDRPR